MSQSLSLSALRESVAVVWHDRLSVDVLVVLRVRV